MKMQILLLLNIFTELTGIHSNKDETGKGDLFQNPG
jgi:hypothetical protein